MNALEIVGIVFAGMCSCFVVLMLAGLIADEVIKNKKRRGTATRAKKVIKARVIKTPHIRQRLEANRAIVAAMNDMQAALDKKREDKKQARYEAIKRWQDDWHEIEPEPDLVAIETKKRHKGKGGMVTMQQTWMDVNTIEYNGHVYKI